MRTFSSTGIHSFMHTFWSQICVLLHTHTHTVTCSRNFELQSLQIVVLWLCFLMFWSCLSAGCSTVSTQVQRQTLENVAHETEPRTDHWGDLMVRWLTDKPIAPSFIATFTSKHVHLSINIYVRNPTQKFYKSIVPNYLTRCSNSCLYI